MTRFGQSGIALAACLFVALAWTAIAHPVIAPVVAVLPVIAIFGLRQPFLLAIFFVLFSFFRLHEVVPQLGPLKLPQLLALGTLASLGWNLVLRQIEIYWEREFTIFACFFVLVTIGVLLATNRAAAMGSFTGTYVKIAIMVLAISWLAVKPETFRLTARLILAAGILVGLVALYNKANGIGLVEGTRVTIGRDIGSMLGDPNDLSLVLLFPASFGLGLMLSPKQSKMNRLFGLIGFAIVAAAVIATQSRGGLLGTCAVVGLFGYRMVKNKAIVIVAGVILGMALFTLAGINDRSSGGAHEEGIDESAMGRLYAWEAAIGMGIARPLYGVGINNFISNYFDYSSHWDGKNHAVHSTWFGVLAETGFLGLSLFLAMVGCTVKRALNTATALKQDHENGRASYDPDVYAMAQAVLGGLIGFVVSGTFLTMGFTWPFYILMALTLATSRAYQALSHAVSQDEKQRGGISDQPIEINNK